jgi:Leucine-rich repeat (LRR) protein
MLIYIKYQNIDKIYTFNLFEEIQNYDNIVRLDCSNNQLTSLAKLPDSLQILYCWNNQLTSLPELPNSLQHLYCNHNQLTSLPELPNSLQHLYCNDNKFIRKLKYKYIINIIFN